MVRFVEEQPTGRESEHLMPDGDLDSIEDLMPDGGLDSIEEKNRLAAERAATLASDEAEQVALGKKGFGGSVSTRSHSTTVRAGSSSEPVGSAPVVSGPTTPTAHERASDTPGQAGTGLSATMPSPVGDPTGLAAAQQAGKIAALEDELAKLRSTAVTDPAAPTTLAPLPTGKGEQILLHFLEDGFSALGQLWYRGQELEIERNGPAWAGTCDVFGVSWVDMDDAAQYNRFGKVMFRHGGWPFNTTFDVKSAAEAELKRARRAPILPAIAVPRR